MNEQMVIAGSQELVTREESHMKPITRQCKEIPPETKQKFDMAYLSIIAILLVVLAISLVMWRLNERKTNYENDIRAQAVETYKAELQAKAEEESAARSLAMNSEAARIKYEIELFAKLFEGARDYHFSERSLITYGLSAYNRVDSEDPLYADTLHDVLTQHGQYETFSDDNPVVSDYRKVAEKLVNLRYNGESKPITSDYVWAVFIDGEVWLTKKFGSSNITDYWQYTG